jgi:hypothetical protein
VHQSCGPMVGGPWWIPGSGGQGAHRSSRRMSFLGEDQKEEGCSGNLIAKLDGGGALATWPTSRQ